MTKKQHATQLLSRYDAIRKEMREVERELHKACADYGREIGMWGFNKDHMRIRIMNEQEKESAP